MIDTEVVRLRQLRDTALRARALAAALEPTGSRRKTLYSRSAVSCWRIARIVTGRLRAHPYLNYQRDASALRAVLNGLSGRWLAGVAHNRGTSMKIFAAELQRVAREVDNARALTWSADFSDTLGRLQTEFRQLIKEADAAARKQAGAPIEAMPLVESGANGGQSDARALAANWPYLAF